MPIIPLSCPSCGAKLEVNSDDSILTCKYCGTNSVMKDAIVHNYIQNTVNITAGTVNVVNQKDFVIEGGVLKKYQGEAVDVVIPDNVYSIGDHAFEGMFIRNVEIQSPVISIGAWAFKECRLLESITIPKSTKEIGAMAFEYCTSLKSVTIPNGVTAMGWKAFGYCTSLTSVTLPDCVKITAMSYRSAFEGCDSLTTVTIGNVASKPKLNSFVGCTSLTEQWVRLFEGTAFFVDSPPYCRQENKCQYCGGEFNLFSICRSCKKSKDY